MEMEAIRSSPSLEADAYKSFIDKYEWLIRIRAEVCGVSLPQFKSDIVLAMQAEVTKVYEELESQLSGHDTQIFPQRLIEGRGVSNEQLYICYWLIGLPRLSPSELSSARRSLKQWQTRTPNFEKSGIISKMHHKFVPQMVIKDQNLAQDISELHRPEPSTDRKETPRIGDTFKKETGSNPAQIRKQFIQHAMEERQETASPEGTTRKLRPPRDIFNRLKFGSDYDVDQYVVGYIDRKLGILVKPVREWQEYEDMQTIAYFKHVPGNSIVWDRTTKVDRIFNSKLS